ncbi:hypothetical protein Tco_0889257 [Tanacetum coccineum]
MVRPSQEDKWYVRLAWTRVPEKARNKGGPRETQRNMGVYTPYPRKDTFTPLIKTLKEILAMESVSFPEPPPLIRTPEKQNLNKLCDYHGDRGYNTNDCYQLKKQIEEVMASGKLAHLVKDIRQNNQQNRNQGKNGVKFVKNHVRTLLQKPQCQHPVKTQKVQDSDDRFFRSNISPPGSNRSSSNYGKGRKKNGMRSLRGVGSTIHSMIKFLTNQWVVTMETSREAIRECKHLERVQGVWKEIQWRQHEEQMSKIKEQVILRTKNNSGRGSDSGIRMDRIRKNSCSMIHHGASIKDIPHVEPMTHKRRPIVPEGRVALKEKGNLSFSEEKGRAGIFNGEGVYLMMQKVLADQRGRNVEIYLEEIVIKSKNKRDLVQDVEETLRKLKSIKIDPVTSSFGVKEGAIVKFIPKLAELKYPIRKARIRLETAKEFGWTNEAEEALRKIKGNWPSC